MLNLCISHLQSLCQNNYHSLAKILSEYVYRNCKRRLDLFVFFIILYIYILNLVHLIAYFIYLQLLNLSANLNTNSVSFREFIWQCTHITEYLTKLNLPIITDCTTFCNFNLIPYRHNCSVTRETLHHLVALNCYSSFNFRIR